MTNEIDEADIRNREARARNAYAKLGYKLKKTPARSVLRKYFDVGYEVSNLYQNSILVGCSGHRYSATLKDVEEFLREVKPVL
ncbi:hypothetical protein [Methylocella sp.]|uniref:hypothetical protein n=1 Tax=Methylocella sp. TaxID=1978226 RepID=UPI0037837F57